ncbi:hypothetical protein CHLRE_12g554300v5 [Chlamydomonas reinhardtii]|uniref:Reticulon domain-containing protein n=1 Tax=Chlamydomonas reinhardtii TaxID=3055 RepID=A0A2K3D5X7_CHLRE|nr:uncharacterized protein CHLRE_12g554300v5 [Chlamydomonas reinhardtii]PNW75934.1 hypothetical protein CHLRE_12g554300v5 [Chlamydomonas reinhardtii]
MLYECSCGFSASTATSFYKHLAASKESASGHQLVQARFTDSKIGKAAGKKQEDGATEAAPSAPPSWVDEYLVVDQREATVSSSANSSLMATAAAAAASRGAGIPPQAPRSNRVAPLPVSSSAGSMTSQQPQQSQSQQQPTASLNAGGAGVGGVDHSKPGSTNALGGAAARGDAGGLLDVDEVELVERTSSYGGYGGGGGSGGSRVSGSGTAAAALRMSGTVMNAVAVGLSPWRWFSTGAGGGVVAGSAGGGGGLAEATAATAGANEFGTAGSFSQGGLMATASGRVGSMARAGGSGGGGGVAEPPMSVAASQEAVLAVQAVLMWHNPWRTGRIFGAGLYLFVCLRQLAKGHDLLQPSTALLVGCFLLLLRNLLRQAVAMRRAQQQEGSGGGAATEDGAEAEAEHAQAAVEMQQRVELVLRRAALGGARYGAALFVLGAGLLSGRRGTTSALVAALLWLGCVVGELRVMSQPTFWLLCYLGCFTIPAAYGRCRAAMDEGTEAALRFVARLLVTGSRASLALAGGVGVVLLAALPLNLVLRATLAAVAAFGVLLWQSEALQQAKAGMYGGGAGGAGGVGGAGRAYLVQEEAKGQGGGGGGSGGGAGLRVPLSHMHRE